MPLDLQKYFELSPFFTGAEKMPDLVWEKFNEKVGDLPTALADLLVDAGTSSFIQSLTQKYVQLSVQGPDVARVIRDIIIGDVFIGDMPQELSKRLGVDQQLAREIVNQIVSHLFTPVIEDLKKLHNEKYPGRLPNKPTTPLEPEAANGNLPITGQAPQHYPGEELPESGGNIIDLRNN